MALACILTLGLGVAGLAAGSTKTFSDIPADADYAKAVEWCVENGLMNGVGGGGRFAPDGAMTRAMLATVLYRQAGSPAVTGAPGFTDTLPNVWYSDAVVWASGKRILLGYGNRLFGVNDPVSREVLTVAMARQKGEDPVWTGDPALAIPAKRSEAAVALYETFCEPEPAHRPSGGGGAIRPTPTPAPTPSPVPGSGNLSGVIPEELEYVPSGYTTPAQEQGTLEKLDYDTWESFSYAQKTQKLTKTAWVYLPYGYDESKPYNILYLSHGGWSNETSTMGTPGSEREFKHIVDHAIQDGVIQPLIIVLPTYNNTSPSDSGDYSLALQLTRNFHNELVNDLIPAAESKYSTYAQSTDLAGLAASRDHRAFGGFSMGSMNTWRTFQYCLDYFRYFAPSSGGPIGDGDFMANIVHDSGHDADDFFIFTASGTADFAYSGFKSGVMAMANADVFTLANNETDGNLSFLEREGYSHDGRAANEYLYNALRFFWNAGEGERVNKASFTADTPVREVINDPAFEGFGRLLFPVDTGYWSGDTLGALRLTWYSHIDPNETVDIVNILKDNALTGQTVFYDIYTEAEKAADPDKRDTGLFFFKGEAGKPFAICSAGGGWAYVGAMHDSFPHALELSKKGYNAFAIIYRPGAQTACEDLARAISLIFAHADELEVSTDCYSLWGGSAGGRMTAYLSSYGPAEFGGDDLPRPGASIIQYTGHSDYTGQEPPTYVCVGESDGIANWRTMEHRQNALAALGIETEFHHYPGLGHGFGLGTGTVAQGWLDEAAAFWQRQIDKVS